MDHEIDHQPQQTEGAELDMAAATKPTTAIARSLGASLAISSVDELMKLANVLYSGGASLIQGLGRPESVAHVILAGAEVGFAPTQALGCIMLLDGKTTIYGDGALALVRASGLLEGEVFETVDGEGDERKATCKIQRKGESQKTFTFSMGEAKRAGLIERAKGKGPWATYPDRMLKMRARGFALRDIFSDVLRGLAIYEELKDVSDPSVVNTEVKVLGTTADQATGSPMTVQHPETKEAIGSAMVPANPFPNSPTIANGYAKAATTPTATQAVAPAPAGPDPNGPITVEQKTELAKLHPLVMASKSISDKAAQRAHWEQVLAPYGVSSINQMTYAVAAKAIKEIGESHDPFGHPKNGTPTSAT